MPLSRFLFLTVCALVLAFASPALRAQTGALTFSASDYAATASTSAAVNATITVQRVGGSSGAAAVSYGVFIANDTTATNLGLVASGYDLATYSGGLGIAAGRLSWAAGDTSPKTFNVAIAQRPAGVHNGDSRVWLVLDNHDGAAPGTLTAATLTVRDPAPPSAGVLKFTRRGYYADRATGSATITVQRSGGTTGAVSVSYATSTTLPAWVVGNSGVAAPPSASTSTDYTATSGTLSWADGETGEKSFTIPLLPGGSGLNEAIGLTLSAPTGGAVLGNAASASCTLLTAGAQLLDVYDQAYGSNTRIWLPPASVPLRGILFHLPGTGNNTLGACNDFNWQQAAQALGLAIVGTRGNLIGDDTEAGLADLHATLRQLADHSGRRELLNAPLFYTGFSKGGFTSNSALNISPSRLVGYFAYRAGDWAVDLSNWPVQVGDTQRTLTVAQQRIPGFFAVGNTDTTVRPGRANIAFAPRRAQGAQVAYGVDWGTGHASFGAGSSEAFMWTWLAEVMRLRFPTTGRTAPGPNPGETVALQDIPDSAGWLSPHSYTFSATNKNGDLSGGYQPFPAIGAEPSYVGNKLAANWLPSATVARAFQAFNAYQTPIGGGNLVPANGPLNTPLQFVSPARLASLPLGRAVPLALDPRRLTGSLARVQFYENDTLLGTVSAAPWQLAWTPSTAGIRTLSAIATDGSGNRIPAFTTVSVQSLASPGFVQFRDLQLEARRSAGAASVVITRSGGDSGAVSATWTISGGTAVSGTDYSGPTSGTVSWSDGDAAPSTVSIPLPAGSPRLPRTINLALSNPTGGLQLPPAREGTDGAPSDTRRAALTVTIFDDTAPPPSPWSSITVGASHGQPTEASLFAEDTFLLRGATNENWGTSDWFRYVMQPISGDCTFTARVVSQGGGGSFPRAGVMIRQGTATDAPFFAAQTVGNSSSIALYRASAGAGTANAAGSAITIPNAWVRVVRSGNTFTAFTSPDGSTWTQVGSAQTIAMSGTVYAGLVWANNSSGGLATEARFDNVTLTGSVPAPTAPVLTGTPFATVLGSTHLFLSRPLAASGQPLPTFSIVGGTPLPAGLELNPVTGLITGVPQSAGTTTVTVRASNAAGTSDALLTFNISQLNPPVVTAATLPDADLSQTIAYQPAATNGPTEWALVSGALPAGVTLNTATGALTGAPALAGTYGFSLTATNAAGTSSAAAFTLRVLTARPPLVVEDFDYGAGTLGAVNGGSGWQGAWGGTFTFAGNTITGSAPASVGGGSLSAAVSPFATAGNKLTPAATSSWRKFSATHRLAGDAPDTLYFSFLVRPLATTAGTVFRLRETAINGTYSNFEFGNGGSSNWTLAGGYGSGGGGSGTQTSATNWALNTTVFVVGKIVTSATGNDQTFVRVYPAGGTVAATDTLVTTNTLNWSVNRTDARASNVVEIAGGAIAELDALRIGDTYASVTVPQPVSALASFRTANGLAADGSQDAATPAGDGVANLLKYAFNMLGAGVGQASALTTPNASVLTPDGTAGLPFCSLLPAPGSSLQITYIRRKASTSPGVAYAVEFSDTLATWSVNASATESVTSLDSTFERVTVTDSAAVNPRRFARVRVAAD